MSTQVTVAEAVEHFGHTYRSIEIRSAAVLQGETWTNSLSVIRLTYEELPEAEERLQQHFKRLNGPVKTKSLRVAAGVRPFSEWTAFCDEVASGLLRVGGLEFQLRHKPQLASEKGQLDLRYDDVRPFDGVRWPGLVVRIGAHESIELGTDDLRREVAALRHSDPYELVNLLCDVGIERGRAPGYHLYFSLPVFATVVTAAKSAGQERLQVMIKRHSRLDAVDAVVCVRPKDFGTGQRAKVHSTAAPLMCVEASGALETAIGGVDVSGLFEDDDWVEVKLIHPALGDIETPRYWQARTLIPPQERNILVEALRKFCPDAELQVLLTLPQASKARKTGPSPGFELRVSWLLALLGFSTIVLGEYERLAVPETGVTRGTMDILAAHPDGSTLLAVGCTINAPNESDFGTVINVSEILARDVFVGTSISVLPVLFTAARGCDSYRELEEGLRYVPVVDADRLEVLLALLRVGQEQRFFEFLQNPEFSPLRMPG